MMMSTLHTFGDWLSSTALSGAIKNSIWIIPAVQIVHILCVAIVISSVFLVDLRLLNAFAPTRPLAELTTRFLKWIWYVLPVLLVTGALLIIGEPDRALTNPAFFLKMLLLLTVIAVTWIIQRPLRTNPEFWVGPSDRRTAARAIAIVSLVLWSGIVFAGRWIAYVGSY